MEHINCTPKSQANNGKKAEKNPQKALHLSTALGPNDPDDGDTGRQQRGMAIAAITRIDKGKLGYIVPSQSGNGKYVVAIDDEAAPYCTCPDFERRNARCKHIYAVEFAMMREDPPVESPEWVDKAKESAPVKKPTYKQNWVAYNAAQVNEQELFGELLRELCDTIPQPVHEGRGRPKLPLSDMVFTLTTKVYSTMSTRRAMTDVRHATANGQLDTTPSFTSIFRYMENPELTPLLKSLIEQSAIPLQDVEEKFAADSSGFGTKTYVRWFDHKWGKEIREAQWVKAHAMCGVLTHIVTSAEVTAGQSSDATQMPAMVVTTAKNFTVKEVSADKAYLSRYNLKAVDDVGGVALIPFKVNSTANSAHHKRDDLWTKMYHYFNMNREEFLARYHLRSNIETTFSMIKAKFGSLVRSKTPTAQVNEVLAKILCHNIVVLIQAMYELGVEPTWEREEDSLPVAA